ncbi:MAG: SDR family oxidoreductase [Alphaproteobacteria bacterium]|nr:SDR family oxidoreductase [Alphaproteobacteria bacterium]
MRLKDKIVVVVGGGQTKGDTIGNGRAAALLFAREGASVMLVDRDLASAQETQAMIEKEGNKAWSFRADITREADCRAFAQACKDRHGRIDCLHNVVGIGISAPAPRHFDEDVWDQTMTVNLKGMMFSCKHVLPHMREQRAGSIVNISSIAAVCWDSVVAYKTSKAGVNALTHFIAMNNADHGVRANVIMPGKVDTPMAIEGHVQARNIDKNALRAERDAHIPLNRKMGTAWDIAHAALFLHSDEARFITAVVLPVDGGESARIG